MALIRHITRTTFKELPKNLPKKLLEKELEQRTNPPLVETWFDEDQIIQCLRQNGWRLRKRGNYLTLSKTL